MYFQKYWEDASYPGIEKADSTNVTFFFLKENETSVTAKLIVVMSGRPLEQDLNFKLRVVDKLTTALPEEYTLKDHYTFRAKPLGTDEKMFQDTISIQLNKTARLKTLPEGFRLALQIVEDENVKLGQKERTIAVLRITEFPNRPTWWTPVIEVGLLGKYSPEKYRLFLENVPGAELIDETYMKHRPDVVRKMVLDFKKWLVTHPHVDGDGEPITVPV